MHTNQKDKFYNQTMTLSDIQKMYVINKKDHGNFQPPTLVLSISLTLILIGPETKIHTFLMYILVLYSLPLQ